MVVDDSKTSNASESTMENIHQGPQVPYTLAYKGVGEMMWDAIKKYESRIAQLDARTNEVVTFAELQQKSVKCALWLREQGIGYRDVITVCTHNHVNSFVPCLAAMYNNVIFNTWDDEMNFQTALHFLQLTMPKIIFCNEKSVDVILAAIKEKKCDIKIVVFGNYPDLIPFSEILNRYSDTEVENFRQVKVRNAKDTICILHSSGTTGLPKGIELSHYALLYTFAEENFNMKDVSLWFSSLYWISGVMLTLLAIKNGSKMIIYPEFNEEMTCILIEKYEVVWLFMGTSMVNRLLKAGFVKNYSLPSLQFIMCGGAILDKKSQDELNDILPRVNILQLYGMTELCGAVTSQAPFQKSGSCGIPARNVQIKIVEPESGKILGPNQTGEVCVKTPNTMNGYYRNPEATSNIFDDEGWLHTGDLGYFNQDSELFIVDRLKELIKYRGYHVSPTEIEAMLLCHPDLLEVGVVGLPHPTDDEHPIAFVSKKAGAKVTEQELKELVANNMTDRNKLRAGVVFLDTFPYTASGKISKKELKMMAKKLAVK